MKPKPTLFFLTLILIAAYGCKKDKSSNAGAALIGKWSINKTVYHYAKDTTITGISTDYYNFASDGALTIHDHSDSYTGKFSMTNTASVNIRMLTVNGLDISLESSPTAYTISYASESSIVLSSPPIPAGQTVIYLNKQ